MVLAESNYKLLFYNKVKEHQVMKEISNKTNLQVLHEDNHIIVVNKRVGDIVQGDKTGDKPLSEVVKEYIKTNTINQEKFFLASCTV
jgi:23S rRNA-/tRNA-specific pseudouridylate synthase